MKNVATTSLKEPNYALCVSVLQLTFSKKEEQGPGWLSILKEALARVR